jgi:hypothetical protein
VERDVERDVEGCRGRGEEYSKQTELSIMEISSLNPNNRSMKISHDFVQDTVRCGRMNIKQLFSYPQTAVMNNGAQDEKSETRLFH